MIRLKEMIRLICFFLLVGLTGPFDAEGGLIFRSHILKDVDQLVVVVTDGWNSSEGKLMCYTREGRKSWRPQWKEPVPVVLGSKGLAWGRGAYVENGKRLKKEGDGCAPAGIFKIGKIYGESKTLPAGSNYPYHRITKLDAWVDDPENPFYNRHVRIGYKEKEPVWFQSQRMRLGDPAYKWLIEIRHNSDPPKPGYGSAIFFHVERGSGRKTAGCTAMKLIDLERIISFLNKAKNTHYILLPNSEYKRKKKKMNFPDFSY